MTGILSAIAEKVVGYLVAPIGRRLSYLFCYWSYTDELHDKVQKLGKARDDTKLTVKEALQRGDKIRPVVQEWLNRVDEITRKADELMRIEDKSCFNGCCPNLQARYLLSREADKMAQLIVEVQKDRNFPDGLSHRVPPRNLTFKNYEPFESRASILNEIMDALGDDKIKMIGVCGMGGVGKTTLVKQVAEQAKQGELFTTEVYIDVSWTRDSEELQQGIAKIQQKIADMLGLKFTVEDESTKAVELKQRLKKEKILIILDDIWKEIDMEEVGIPCKEDQAECKVVLTSRDLHLIRQDMDAEKCFLIQKLPPEEAWSLFNKTAGGSLEKNLELQPTAIQVAEECEGLPIAIVTIAKALKGKSVAVWRNALEELRRSAPTNIRGLSKNLYSCLELSYNHLESDEVKSLFLLCGFLGDDAISMDNLLNYGLGLDLFGHVNSLEEARDKLITLVETLKDSSLLFGVEEYGYFRASTLMFIDADDKFVWMHDLVHKVARAIASKASHPVMVKDVVGLQKWSETDDFKNCTHISLECRGVLELPEGLVCPKLECFLLNSSDYKSLRIPDSFFQEMKQLKVLGLFGMQFESLPSSFHFLSNLQTLCLENCEHTYNVTAIEELKKLKVLKLVSCGVQKLSNKMMQLIDLRVLDLRHCSHLKIIPGNLLSSLTQLEYLCMKHNYFTSIDAGFFELKGLKYLSNLDVEIKDPDLLTDDVLFEVEKLSRYSIIIGNKWSFPEDNGTSKKVILSEVKRFHLLEWFSKLLTKTQDLDLWFLDDSYEHVHKSDGEGFLELKYLRINNSRGIQYIVNSKEWVPKSGAFPVLEKLNIWNLENLDAVYYGPIPSRSLSELKILEAVDCERLKYLILLPTAPGREYLEFPNLQSLELRRLPKLISFYSIENNATQEPSTSDVHIPFFNLQVALRSLKSLSMEDLDGIKTLWHNQLPMYSFCKLESLYIRYCKKLLNVCPFNILKGLQCLRILVIDQCQSVEEVFNVEGMNDKEIHDIVSSSDHSLPSSKSVWTSSDMRHIIQNLEELEVTYCDSIKEVIQVKEPVGEEDQVEIVFTKLRKLELSYLENLISFCSARYAFKFPSLKDIRVSGCPKMEYFCKGVLSTPMLQKLKRDDSGEPDLNTTIHNEGEYCEGEYFENEDSDDEEL